jgi:hypothetical protein
VKGVDAFGGANTVNFWAGTDLSVTDLSDIAQVRCVSGSMKEHVFERNSTTQIVMDRSTDLMWQDNDNLAESSNKTWLEAIDYCESLELGGYADWRLPNPNEFLSIVEQNATSVGYDPAFVYTTSDLYWTSSTKLNNGPTYARSIRVDALSAVQPYVAATVKSTTSPTMHVRCVRGGN